MGRRLVCVFIMVWQNISKMRDHVRIQVDGEVGLLTENVASMITRIFNGELMREYRRILIRIVEKLGN